ncbi:hypothetical protein F0Q32_19700 [Pseudocitrobacter sp. 73]|nr:hypothetical protein F0Q32_19700 [Pseudocitrobacter sp. 73]
MTNIKHYCYNHHLKKHIMRKSYGVTLSPDNKLCNSVLLLTKVIRKDISDRQVLTIRAANVLIC